MKFEYKSKVTPIVAKTVIENCDVKDAMFFIYREDGYVDYEVVVNRDIAVEASLQVVKETEKGYTLLSNTTNIIATNIMVDGVVYFYKIYVLGSSDSLRDSLLNSNIGVVYHNGNYYTNSVVTNYELMEGVFIFSKPVIENNNFTYTINGTDIKLFLKRDNTDSIYFKPKYKLSIQPNYISDTRIHFDTFSYIKDRSKKIAVEGDIVIQRKREYNEDIGNSSKCKDLIYDCDLFYTDTYNQIYTDKFYYTKTTRPIIEYTCKKSNHIFDIDEQLHFKIDGNNFITCAKEDSDFTIRKKIDYNKIHIELNNYLEYYKNILPTEEYIFSNSMIEDNRKIALKELVKTNLRKFPSEKYYIAQDNSVVFQHINSTISDVLIPVMNKHVEKHTYSKNELLYDNFIFKKIEGVTYYKYNSPYLSNLITEDYKAVLVEDENNLELG